MNANDVKNYRFLDRAIRVARRRCDDLRDMPVMSDKVYGSNPEFPYESKGFNVSGSDMSYAEIHKAQYEAALEELQRLQELKHEIEDVAMSLVDVQDKAIFEGIMNGQSQTQIAITLCIDQSYVSKKFRKILEKF
jgi:hypothetical protein